MKADHIFATLAFVFCLPTLAAGDAGIVQTSKGEVRIERSGIKVAVAPSMPVKQQDRIVTGKDSSVAIRLNDNTMLSAGPNSILDLNRYSFNTTTLSGALDATLKRGTLAVISGAIAKTSPQSVRFHTQTITLGVRGTEFMIDAGQESE